VVGINKGEFVGKYDSISQKDRKRELQKAAKRTTMSHVQLGRGGRMATIRRQDSPQLQDDDSIFDDADALIALAQKSFAKATKKAIAENDVLGIPSPYSRNGKIYFRQPSSFPR
jgi:hypothetical protein